MAHLGSQPLQRARRPDGQLRAGGRAKIERGFEQDLADVRTMIARGLVEPARLRQLYEQIEPELYRYPAIDPPAFRHKLDAALR